MVPLLGKTLEVEDSPGMVCTCFSFLDGSMLYKMFLSSIVKVYIKSCCSTSHDGGFTKNLICWSQEKSPGSQVDPSKILSYLIHKSLTNFPGGDFTLNLKLPRIESLRQDTNIIPD